ncbi:MAG: sensor histidine kinase [Chitinophagaceae bacterium]|nr:sensor histidine kinase [Chitinophagaceae bacterium]
MKKRYIFLFHALYWLLYLLLLLVFLFFLQGASSNKFIVSERQLLNILTVTLPLLLLPAVLSFYFSYHWLFSRYLSQKKIWALCFGSAIAALLCAGTGMAALYLVTQGDVFRHMQFKDLLILLTIIAVLAILHGVMGLLFKGFIFWYEDIALKEQLQRKNWETEMALVKAKLHPHFLFNTINNIDVLIHTDADKASGYLNQLSDILRFMLYETNSDAIPLTKELEYIDKYIALQRIRNAHAAFVRYELAGDPDGWMIAPMLFIPFIENAFKYAGYLPERDAIVIKIAADADALRFTCENIDEPGSIERNEEGGIGNALIQQRIALLYPQQHQLQFHQENGRYSVDLIIYRHAH